MKYFGDISVLQNLLTFRFVPDASFQLDGFTSDSQKVKDGYLFVALSEVGNSYIEDAIKNGASMIISSLPQHHYLFEKFDDVFFLYHPNPREIYHKIAAEFYPNQPQNICAVTGTNGKTSTVNFVQQLWSLSGRNSMSIGTLGTISNIDPANEKTELTTSDSEDLHRVLNNAKNLGVEHAVIEASSHGIEQMRMHSVNLKVAGFTSFSLDHLDYHKTFEEYLKAKIKLFNEILPKDGYAILNSDIKEYLEISSSIHTDNIITYGRNSNHLQLLAQESRIDGQDIFFNIFDKKHKIYLPMFGKFQAYNLLCAIGLLLYSDRTIKFEDLCFDKISQIPGRLELIPNNIGIIIVLDYSHTPDGLREAILSLEWHFKKKVNLVFGCGGNRDKSKRSLMGSIASDLANMVVVCDDNPRMEEPSAIRKDILMGCRDKNNVIEIADRAEAINYVIKNSKKSEVILITGKGAENYQIIGKKKVLYSDVGAINDALMS